MHAHPLAAAAPRLLLVEDDLPLVELLTWHFSRQDIAVTSTSNGGQALSLAEARRPDAVLLDWKLEGLCGLEVCRRLRTTRATAALPIIMISARDSAEDRKAAFANGADDYLSKPFRPIEVVALVKAWLDRAAGTA